MSPAWSPDGQSLAYVSFESKASAIYVQTLRTGERRRVSARAGINGAPAWSPDGGTLALTLSRKDGDVDVYTLNLASQVLTRMTFDPGIDTEPTWSADGRKLYFMSDRAGGPQIYEVDVSAAEPRDARHVRGQLQRAAATVARRQAARPSCISTAATSGSPSSISHRRPCRCCRKVGRTRARASRRMAPC